MAKIICKLPNASELIGGVKFVTHKLGMISEEIADEVAAGFLKIEGYVLAEDEKVKEAVTGDGKNKGKGSDKGRGSSGSGDGGAGGEGGADGKSGAGDNDKSVAPPVGGANDAK